jgi:hypothetical protein
VKIAYRAQQFKSYKASMKLKKMNHESDSHETVLSELDELMQIAQAIEKSSRPLPNTEISK